MTYIVHSTPRTLN